jgi:hypothetical protein
MADANVTHQPAHVGGAEYITHQAIVLTQIKTVILEGYDTGRILTPVLEYRQSVIQRLIDILRTDNSYNSTHGCCVLQNIETTALLTAPEP